MIKREKIFTLLFMLAVLFSQASISMEGVSVTKHAQENDAVLLFSKKLARQTNAFFNPKTDLEPLEFYVDTAEALILRKIEAEVGKTGKFSFTVADYVMGDMLRRAIKNNFSAFLTRYSSHYDNPDEYFNFLEEPGEYEMCQDPEMDKILSECSSSERDFGLVFVTFEFPFLYRLACHNFDDNNEEDPLFIYEKFYREFLNALADRMSKYDNKFLKITQKASVPGKFSVKVYPEESKDEKSGKE